MQVSGTAVYKLSADDLKEALAQYMDTNYGENIGDNFEVTFKFSLNISNEGFDPSDYKEVISSIEIHVKD